MKIIFINRYFYPDQSATSQLLTDLAFDLSQDKNIHIITSSQRYDDPKQKLPPFEIKNSIQIHRLWTTRFGRQRLLGRAVDYLSFYFSAAWRLWRLTSKADVVIAKTDPPFISVVAAVIVKLRGATLINWLQDVYPEIATSLGVVGMRRGPLLSILQWLRNRSLRSALTNVVLGHLMAKRLEQLGIASSKIRIIPNWVDGDHIQPIAKANNPLTEKWGLSKQFVVGYSGNMGRAHEFATILEAAEKLIEDKQIIFLFIGDGPMRTWIKHEVQKRSLTNVMFRPYQPREELSNSLTVPDVHLISLRSDLEGLIVPSKFYGIAAAGRATLYIGDKAGEIPRILDSNNCGLTISEQDSDDLANHIKRLANNPQSCQEMGNNARDIFEKLYNKPIAFGLWRQVLDIR
ncbi:glycosyltransferase family 4 protein [Candidatus Marithrix sp. Canyon 246]|uniref:glycosyltransferase family 4 protein n=1 Tax=Candidatus Marithrix sp. Canyon 246 TaxID=1827136 RepID=UPI00084A17AC|nr:glycosyltransferase family 4 protein [Candidatus Marithrix sp. Canyon 246]